MVLLGSRPHRSLVSVAIERVIGYTFKDKSLVAMSMKRKQEAINGSLFNWERMAFLGDALIDFLITWQLHERKATESVGAFSSTAFLFPRSSPQANGPVGSRNGTIRNASASSVSPSVSIDTCVIPTRPSMNRFKSTLDRCEMSLFSAV